MDADPLLHIDSGDLVYTINNLISFWNGRHQLQKDHIMHGLCNLPTTTI
jgi:hypothetical protein